MKPFFLRIPAQSRSNFEKWLSLLSDPNDNPFWYRQISPGDDEEPPLDPDAPSIHIVLPHFTGGRAAFASVPVVVGTADEVLFSGNMRDGVISAEIDPERAKSPGWRAPIVVA